MKKIKLIFTIFLLVPFFLFFINSEVKSQLLEKTGANNPGNSVQKVFPGAGIMCAGDLWESFMPEHKGPTNLESSTAATRGLKTLVKVGNFDRLWTTPGGNYPIGFTHSLHWARYIHAMIYDSDKTLNPDSIKGKPNPSWYSDAKDASGKFSNYAYLTWKEQVVGATTANEARWVDATKRHHMVYDASWPTQVGIDVKIRSHAFSGPNWNNLNDFVILEINFKNTGNVDMDMDGVFERTNHKIEALSLFVGDEYSPHACNDPHGNRGSEWCTTAARDFGYIGDPDPDGNPWAFACQFVGTSAFPAPSNNVDMGMIWPRKWYIDTYQGYTVIAVKKGGFPSDIAKSTCNLPDKNNIWGIPAVGSGAQRGWYLSAGTGKGIGLTSLTNPAMMFQAAIGTYLKDGGKTNDKTKVDLNPNPKLFASGNTEDYTKWVPKTTTPTANERPNGDKKLLSEDLADPKQAVQYATEDGTMGPGNTPYPTGWGKWSKGFVDYCNYDGDLFLGAGPVSLDVGEEVTMVVLFGGGFRLEGLQKAMRAGRWAYEKDYVIPEPPPVPTMEVANSDKATVNIMWKNEAENDAQFAGYKIWKSSQFKKYSWLEDGMRLIDKYQEQMTVGENKANFRKPINPKFNATAAVASSSTKGMYPGYTYGTWELIKVIPKSEVSKYLKPDNITSAVGGKYLFEDQNVVAGFTYWYYVSAYKEGTYTGPGNETTTRLETHSLNRNGADGLWKGTYPFATSNADFPAATDAAGRRAIGALQIVYSALANTADLNKGRIKVGVKPNPYKRAALHDNFTNVYEHRVLFYNLPSSAKITITDVSGKIIDIINFTSTDPNRGATFWDMFSKDGQEVASGLYLYFVEWSGGTAKGKFSILK